MVQDEDYGATISLMLTYDISFWAIRWKLTLLRMLCDGLIELPPNLWSYVLYFDEECELFIVLIV